MPVVSDNPMGLIELLAPSAYDPEGTEIPEGPPGPPTDPPPRVPVVPPAPPPYEEVPVTPDSHGPDGPTEGESPSLGQSLRDHAPSLGQSIPGTSPDIPADQEDPGEPKRQTLLKAQSL